MWVADGLPKRTARFASPRGINIFPTIIIGFALLILIGGIFLILPPASASGKSTNVVTALFTSASAVTDTGLVVINTGSHWSFFGQLIILILIQLGGLGFMTITSFLLMLAGQRILFRDFRVADAMGAHGSRQFKKLFFWTFGITLFFESFGIFSLVLGLSGDAEGYPWWSATFHAISAFNNAGFDIIGDVSLANYATNTKVLFVIAGLAFMGALSAPVIIGLVGVARKKQLDLDAKLALITTCSLLVIGAVFMYFMDYANAGTLGPLNIFDKLVNSFFTSVSARTTGFASVNMGALTLRTFFLVMFLMFVGGVSGSTAGGIKVNTFSVLWLTALSYIRGRRHVQVARRNIPEIQIHKAVAVGFFSLTLVVVISLILSITENLPFRDLAFETVSAFSTTGLSTGITSSLSVMGQLFIIMAMFLGRLGPLTVALALAESRDMEEEKLPEADIRVG